MKPLSTNATRRRHVFGWCLLVAVGAAAAAWHWNQLVHSPDPGIVIRTETEAVERARAFLAAAHVSTSAYDLSRTSRITKGRLKGQIVWRIVWSPRPDATVTNELVALACESGWCYTDEMSSTNEGNSIEGDLTNITRQHFVLEGPKGN
jgi:hypothetical protein